MIIRYADGLQFEVTDTFSEERTSGKEVVKSVTETFEAAFENQVKPAVVKVVEVMKRISPNEIEVDFGIKMKADVGAVFSKAGVDGHLNVKLKWSAKDIK
jgi:predicted RecB family endonuclease